MAVPVNPQTASPYSDMTDDQLRFELRRLAALRDPATMGMYLDPMHFKNRSHIRLIAAECTRLGTEFDRLLVTLPPQTGKSTLVSENMPFWMLARNPRMKIVVASYAASLALKKSRAVRRHVYDYGDAFGLAVQRGESNVYDWSTTSGGGMRAVGVGGSLTGFPANCVIVDDPHKDRMEADSLRMRNRVWEWWSSVALSRLRPGSPVVLTLTRWHEDDLAGRVLAHEGVWGKGGRWRVVHLPATATDADDPLGRAYGAPLTHPAIADGDDESLARHWADKKATSTPRDWGALYMGDPQPAEGALLARSELEERRHLNLDPWPPALRRAVAVDPSGGGKDIAGIIAGYLGEDQRLYLTHDRSRRMPSSEWSRRACLLAFETDAQSIIIEKNYGGDIAGLAVGTAWDALQREGRIPASAFKPYITLVSAKSGKYLRAEPIAQQWREDRIRMLAYLPELEEEWATWQPDHTESPGRIDASVYLAYHLLKVPNMNQHIGNPAAVSLTQAANAANPFGPGRVTTGGIGSISLGRDR